MVSTHNLRLYLEDLNEATWIVNISAENIPILLFEFIVFNTHTTTTPKLRRICCCGMKPELTILERLVPWELNVDIFFKLFLSDLDEKITKTQEKLSYWCPHIFFKQRINDYTSKCFTAESSQHPLVPFKSLQSWGSKIYTAFCRCKGVCLLRFLMKIAEHCLHSAIKCDLAAKFSGKFVISLVSFDPHPFLPD